MSIEYDMYLTQHRANVYRGFEWIRDNMPDILKNTHHLEWHIQYNHDKSKNDEAEYEAYDRYFYGGNRSYSVVQDFKRAWLRHIHQNEHHWQHWILHNDDPSEGMVVMDMPINCIVEMICDWWAFSWANGNLYEIFSWYDEHKDYMKLSNYTRERVEYILAQIKAKLDEGESDEET